jgi:hypothetical protein
VILEVGLLEGLHHKPPISKKTSKCNNVDEDLNKTLSFARSMKIIA